jgi:hypothetical protein
MTAPKRSRSASANRMRQHRLRQHTSKGPDSSGRCCLSPLHIEEVDKVLIITVFSSAGLFPPATTRVATEMPIAPSGCNFLAE